MKPRLKRLMRWGIAFILSCLLLFLLAHTPPAKRGVALLISTLVSRAINPDLLIGELDYRLWRGEVRAEDVSLVFEDAKKRFSLELPETDITLSPAPAATVRRPRMSIQLLHGVKKRKLRPDDWFFVPFLPDIDLVNGHVLIQFNETDRLQIDDIHARGDWNESGLFAIDARATHGSLDLAGGNLPFGPMNGKGSLSEEKGLEVENLHAQAASSEVTAEGALAEWSPVILSFSTEYTLDAEVVKSWFPEAELAGALTGSSLFEYRDHKFRGEGVVREGSLRWGESHEVSIRGGIKLDDGVVALEEMALKGDRGRIDLDAQMELADGGTQRFQAKFSDADLEQFANDLAEEVSALTSRAHGDGELILNDWNLDDAEVRARIELRPGSAPNAIPVGGSIAVSGKVPRYDVESRLTSAPLGMELEIEGQLDGEISRAVYRIRMKEAEDARAWLETAGFIAEETPDPRIRGGISIRGTIEGIPTAPFWTAAVSSRDLNVWDEPVQFSADLDGDLTKASLDRLRIEGQAGILSASGNVPLDKQGTWDVDLDLSETPIMSLTERYGLPLAGTVRGQGKISGNAADPDWKVEAHLDSEAFLSELPGEASLSVEKTGSQIRLTEFSASTSEASLEGTGNYGLDSENIEGRLIWNGLSLASLVQDLEGLDGRLAGEIDLKGSIVSPDLRANLRIQDVGFKGQPIDPVSLDVRTEGEQVELDLFVGDQRLARGSGPRQAPYPLQIEVDLASLPLIQVVRGLTQEDPRIDVTGELFIQVPVLKPDELTYQARVASYESAVPGWSHRSSGFTVEGDMKSLAIRDLELSAEGRRFSVEGVVPLNGESPFDLDITGEFGLAFVKGLLRDSSLEGRGRVDLAIKGTYADPDLVGEIELDGVSGSWNHFAWDNVQLRARADADRLNLISAGGSFLGGELALRGVIPLARKEAREPGRIDISLDNLDFGRLLAEDLGELPKPILMLSTRGTIEMTQLALEGLSGSGEISELAFKVEETEVRNPLPASWFLGDSSFSIPELRLEGGATNIRLNLGPVRFGEELAWHGGIQGTLDNTLSNPYLILSGMEISGTSELDFELSDGPSGFLIDGRGDLVGGQLAIPDPPMILSDLRGSVTVEESKVQITGLTARVGGGRLSGESSIDFGDSTKPIVDARAEADGVRLQFAEGVRGQVSGSVRFQGQENFELSGNLIVNQGLFNRELDKNNRLTGSSLQLPSDMDIEEDFADRVSLDLTVQTEERVRVDTEQAKLEANGNLSLAGTLANPEVAGSVSARRDGTFTVGHNRFQIVTGRLELREFPVSSPRLELSAVTHVGNTLIRLDLEGDIDDLHTTLSAPNDPNLTEGDLASLLVTGRTLEEAGEGGQQIASTWAMSSMANLIHEGWGGMFTFGPPLGSGPLILDDEENPTSRLTLGRAITDRFSISYSIALDNAEDQLWILDYRVARNVWVRAIQRKGNEFSLGFSHRFNIDTKTSPSRSTRSSEPQVIAGVSVRGDFPGAEADWLEQVRVRAGSQQDYWATEEDARRIQQKLVEQGFRSAIVDTGIETLGDQIAITFNVQAGSLIEFFWEGDDPGNDIKKEVEKAWDGRVPESYLISDLAARAAWDLRSQRYYLARVETKVEEEAGRRRIVFTVVRGPRGEGVQLQFEGNEAVTDDDLRSALPDTDMPEFFVLLDKPAELAKGIQLLYASRGYLSASPGTAHRRYDVSSKQLQVVIPVDEGRLWRVTSIQFDGADSLSAEEAGSAASLDEGQPFSLPEVREAQVKLKSFYRERGFPDVKVRAELVEAPGGIAVTFQIEEGAPADVGKVRIVGTTRTQESVIRRQLTFKEGDPVRISTLRESQRNLYDTRVFSSVDVRVDAGQKEKEHKDILVQVAERTDFDVSYGLRYNVVTEKDTITLETQQDGLEGTLRTNLFNPFGRGTTLSLSAFVQNERTLFRATERFPHFFKFRLPTIVIAEVERQDRDIGYETRVWSLAFQQTRAWRQPETGRDRFAVQWNVKAGRIRVRGDLDLDGNAFDRTEWRTLLGTSLIGDNRNSLSNPTRGRFWNVTLQVAPKFLGSDTQFVKVYGQIFYHQPIFKSLGWASSYRLGLATGSKEFLFIEERFKAGGANTVRGFKHDSLGPSITIPESDEELILGGQAVVVMNQELRFPIYKMLHGGVFYDTGNVFARVKDIRLPDLRQSAGAGLRLVLPFGAIRLDWARILDLQEGETPSRWHFSFGYAF